jgi:hypothetical protein
VCISLLFDIGDHFVDDQPLVVELVKGDELVVFKFVHFHMQFGSRYGGDHVDRNNCPFEWFAGVFRALAVT